MKLKNTIKNNIKFFALFIVILLFISFAKISQGSINVNLDVQGCNYNNICEPPDESSLNCPNDCTSCNNNGVCELLKGETSALCPSDCGGGRRRPNATSSDVEIPVVAVGTISNVIVKAGINYAIISWNTDVPAYGQVGWGIGDSYNSGNINGLNISIHQEMVIENLSASTTYSYLINASLPETYKATNSGSFTTLPIPKIQNIPSIYNFTATPTSNEIILNWNNPESTDFFGVKIVRSPFFFPTSPSEGKIIYDGNGIYARDSDLVLDTKYYYSAFSYNKDMVFSSGVLVESILKSKTAPISEGVGGDTEYSNVNILPTDKYIFIQGDLELPMSSSSIIQIYPFNDLKIVFDANRFPPDTKILILKIQDTNDKSKYYSYSFKLDPTKKFYYTVIPNLGIKNIYPFTIISYDSNNKESSIARGVFDVKAVPEPKSISYEWVVYLIIIILIFIIL